jgi:hypothetical protein
MAGMMDILSGRYARRGVPNLWLHCGIAVEGGKNTADRLVTGGDSVNNEASGAKIPTD